MEQAGTMASDDGVDADSPAARPAGQALQAALLDSRQRWQELVALACDLAFELDAAGRFVVVTPETVLGWPAGGLVGTAAEALLAAAEALDGAESPFRPLRRAGRRVWLRQADGSPVCVDLVCRPLMGPAEVVTGWRGVGRNVTRQAQDDAALAAALRRADVLDHILRQMRREVLAPRMMATTLSALVAALGADGAAVVDAGGDGAARHQVGKPLNLAASGAGFNHRMLKCALQGRRGAGASLVLWRSAGGRDWDTEDRHVAESATAIVGVILDHEAIQLEMGRQARTDPLTGLLNRRAFMEELARRVERLSRDELPGTLIYVDLDRFKSINDAWGHEVGDVALCIVAATLRNATRPADLVARLGGDEFAMWLDGADQLTAAERAEALRLDVNHALVVDTPGSTVRLTLSIGIACRRGGSEEEIGALVHRADLAMYQVKQAGRGHWRVAPDPDAPVGPAAQGEQ